MIKTIIIAALIALAVNWHQVTENMNYLVELWSQIF